MKVPLSWLKEHVDSNLPPIEIAKILTMAGLEVDAIEPLARGFSNVCVAKVVKTEAHPNADKLIVATVSDGEAEYQVVCGDPSCRAGMKTAFAKIGAVLEEDGEKKIKIKKTKIRGIESFGMLCTEQELKLSNDHSKIMSFDEHVKVGEDVSELYADFIFEISLTPNLGHCANIMGVARELHAATQETYYPVKIPPITESEELIEQLAAVQVKAPNRCPRYSCRLIQNVKIAPSPQWMQNRLLASGIRPINNIVDITNYVLLEMGQPLHAFDYDLLSGHEIIVRCAKEREALTTLDGKERLMHEEDLLICDGEKPVAVAGVMGGQNSEVHDGARSVLLESAYFDPTSIRKTSKRLGVMTEASRRFERGTDPNLVLRALERATALIQELAGGEVACGIIDVKECEFPERDIACRVTRANAILGTQLSVGEVENVFQRLQFDYAFDGDDTFVVTVPTYRVDISAEIDLIEEIARIYGYDNLPKEITRFHSSKSPHSAVYLFEKEVRQRLLSAYLQEFLTCDLIGPSLYHYVDGPIMGEEVVVSVLNPTSIEQSCLRTSLLPGLLQVIKFNYDRQVHDIQGFEIGRIHFKEGGQYREETMAGIVLCGENAPRYWGAEERKVDFYDIKGIIENIFHEYGITDVSYRNNQLPYFHTGRQASFYVGDLEVGTMGEIHPAISRRLDIDERIYFAELNLGDLFRVRRDDHQMKAIPKYPSSVRDWTVTLKEKVAVNTVVDMVWTIESAVLEDVQLLYIYRSDKVGEQQKNVTFRFVYRDKERTISQETVDREHARITDKVRGLLTS